MAQELVARGGVGGCNLVFFNLGFHVGQYKPNHCSDSPLADAASGDGHPV
jgi:hypothetical protein